MALTVRVYRFAAPRSLDFQNVAGDDDPPPTWFLRFFQAFEQRMDEKITFKLNELCVKVKEHDEFIAACKLEMESLQDEIKVLRKDKSNLVEKLDDLENRSRGCNLVFHGVPESKKQEREDCLAVVEELLTGFVGLQKQDYVIERCHRTPSYPLSPRQDQKTPPRIIHVAFASYPTKERVRKACISKFKSTSFKGSKIYVSDDFSKRVIQLRKEKMSKFKSLKEENKKPFFLYPDRLAYRGLEGKLIFV